ncbi:HAD family hydrolase [Sphingomonas lacusdianchii]|uniref:HAD family hydrolase n=1 Tax=Sphingomonas lacusdianchii TaxID=2917992 RepID=UPI001F5652DC|nr:HAD family phosphatase [Sphingomonas sp. JXJ CY 53]
MKQATIPTPLDAVVFDMDGTLLDTERLHHEAMGAAAVALGYRIDPALFAAMVGVHRELNQAMLVQQLGPEFPVEAFYADADARFAVAASTGIRYRPGVRHLLDQLAADGIRCAVATSTESPRAEERLASTGLLGYFEAVVTRSDVAHPKPAPDPYLLAAKRLGVRPEHCLAVEDSLNGIRAAAAAGMATVMVPDLIPPDWETGRLTIATLESLAELEDMLPQRTRPGGRGIGTVIALLLALCTLVLLVMSPAAFAQDVPDTAANSTAAATPRDPYGRETPRGLADGPVAALAGQGSRAGK